MTDERLEKITRVVNERQQGFCVVLEDVHDPHNAAAVTRTCEAFGVSDIRFVFDKQKEYNPKRIGKSSSSSANKWVDFKTYNHISEVYAELKQEGYHIYVTALEKDSISIYDCDFKSNEKVALVFGNESVGVSEDAISGADNTVEIPMWGMVQSLNISVSAAILIYEVSRQRQPQVNKYRLDPDARAELLPDYLAR